MKSVIFTVQIQVDFPKRSRSPKAVALNLCHDLNMILAKYDGLTGGAQIISAPRNIKVTKTSSD